MTLIHFVLDYAQFVFSIRNLIETDIEGALRVFILISFEFLLVFLYELFFLDAMLHNVVLVFLLVNTINDFHVVEFVSNRLVVWD